MPLSTNSRKCVYSLRKQFSIIFSLSFSLPVWTIPKRAVSIRHANRDRTTTTCSTHDHVHPTSFALFFPQPMLSIRFMVRWNLQISSRANIPAPLVALISACEPLTGVQDMKSYPSIRIPRHNVSLDVWTYYSHFIMTLPCISYKDHHLGSRLARLSYSPRLSLPQNARKSHACAWVLWYLLHAEFISPSSLSLNQNLVPHLPHFLQQPPPTVPIAMQHVLSNHHAAINMGLTSGWRGPGEGKREGERKNQSQESWFWASFGQIHVQIQGSAPFP